MTGPDIVKKILFEKDILQSQLAKMTGMRGGSNVSEALRHDLRLSTFCKFLDALGYEVIVKKRQPGRKERDVIVVTYPDQSEGD